MYLQRFAGDLTTFVLLTAALAMQSGVPAAERPAPPRRADIERALAAARTAEPSEPTRPLTVVLLSDRKDHSENEHDYPRWQSRWALLLGGKKASDETAANLYGADYADSAVSDGAADVRLIRADHWPSPHEWDTADLVVAYCYLEWSPARVEEVGKFLGRGGGLVLIHSATWTRPGPSPDVAKLVGVGGFEYWRHGLLRVDVTMPEHPICRGLPATIDWVDEPYWPPTPPVDQGRIEVLAGSQEETEPGQESRSLQPLFWACQYGKGRVFGCAPGHYTWTFDDPYFRILVLRGMAWAAGEDPHRFDELVLRCAAVAQE